MAESSFKKSDEWLERRTKSIGGSDIAAIMGRSPYKTAYQLFLEKTKKVIPPDISSLPHIVRGHLSEEIARDRIERETLTAYRPKFWEHPEYSYMTASDDGYSVEQNCTLEIKAMGKDNHEAARKGVIPAMYLDQVQWGLMVSSCTKCIFISYRVEDDDMVTLDVFPDKKHQDELVAAAQNFWLNHVLKDKPPELQDGDYMELEDANLCDLVEKYKTLHGQVKTLEARLEELTLQLKPYTAAQRAVKCNGVKLLRSERQGTIDYKKFLADQHIPNNEIEKYRKKPTESFRVFLPALDLTKI
jgi:putative phage-type endonuclease